MKKEYKPLVIKKWYKILFITVLSLLIIAGGYFYYNYSTNQIRAEGVKNLTAVAQLKIDQIVQWNKERNADAVVISNGQFLLDAVQKLLKNKNDKANATKIQTKISQFQKAYGYEAIILSSANGEMLLSTGSNLSHLDKETSDRIIGAVKHRKIEHTDFYYCNTEQKIHFDIIAPLINDKYNVVAAIVLRVDPEDFLYPLIQMWPTPSKTAETLLIRKEGDKVLFLNNLKFRKDVALKLEIPLTEKDVPSVQAVLGYKGIWEGNDYRGIKVLSYINNVPGTNWYMISKIDNDEIFSELIFSEEVIILFILLLILSITAGLSWIYHLRQRNIYRELYTTQEGFKATLYSIGDAVITTDNKGKVQHINLVAEKLTGWTEDEAKGQKLEKVFNIINEETRNKVESPLKKVISEGVIVGLANHTLLISKDGKETPIADSGAPIKDENGKTDGVVLIFRDQSEERQMQKLIADSENKYRRLFEAAKDGIIILDSETGKIVDVNPFLIELLGYKKEEFIEKAIWEIGFFKDILANKDKFLELQQKEYVQYKDLPLETASGQKINVEFVSNVYLVDNKKVIQCNIRNITERLTAENKLRLNEERFRNVFENSPIGKSMTGIDGSIKTNKAFCDMLGYSLDELETKNWQEITHPDDIQESSDVVQSLLDGKIASAQYEKRYIHKDGSVILSEVRTTLQKDEQGKPLYFITTIIDITERKRVENAIIESEKFLKETQKIAQLGSYTLNINSGIWKSSEILDSIFGIEHGYDKSIEVWTSIIHPDWQKEMSDYFANEVVALKKPFDKEYKIVRKSDKTERWVHGLGELAFDKDNNPIQMIGTIRDITEKKNSEQEIIKLNRIYAVLSNTNEAIVRIKDRQDLFNTICRIAIEYGKFRMTWIGLVNYDTNKVYAAASAGEIENYLEDINIDLNDETRNQGSSGRAIKNGKHSIANDIENDKNMLPWKERALSLEYKSSAAFPLIVFGKVIGVFTLYSDQKYFFRQHEVRLLNEMAMDISFALEFFETEKRRIKMEETLYQSEERFRSLYENSTIGLYRTTPDGKILLANPALVKMLGYSNFEELAERELDKDGFEPDYERKQFLEQIEISGEVKGFESAWTTKDGKVVYISESARALRDSNGKTLYFDGTVEDITERRITHNSLNESELRFKQISEFAEEWIWEADKNGLYTYASPIVKNILGYESEELIGKKHFYDFFDPEIKEDLIQTALVAFANKTSFKDFINCNIHKDGRKIILSTSGIPIIDKDDNLVGYRGVDIDITERKRAEEELLSSKLFIERIINTIPVRVFWKDKNLAYLGCNEIFARDAGFADPKEIIGKDDFKMAWSEQAELYRNDDLKIIESGESKILFEEFQKTPEGKTITLLTSKIPLQNYDGKNVGILGTYLDITERKRIEAELKKSEEKYRSIFENVQDVYYETLFDGTILEVSPAIELMSKKQYRPTDLIGRSMYEFYADLKIRVAILSALKKDGSVNDFEVELKNRDGSVIHCSVSAKVSLNAEGRPEKIVGSMHDITERKQAQKVIIESEERYRSVAQSAIDAIITTDSKGIVIDWNNAAEKIFGYLKTEMIGNNLSIIIPQNHLENHTNGMKRVEEGGEHHVLGGTVELQGLNKNGKEIPIELSLAEWETSSGKYFTGIIRDITERKIVEAELIQAKEKAEEMNRLKSNFLANMSHELRTPLVGILGYADILSQDLETQELKVMAENIYKSGKRLSETLNLLLDLSKFETEKWKINYQKFDIVRISKEIINSFEGTAQKKGLKLKSSYSQPSITIYFDERIVHSILNNLINNALKFTIEGSVTTTIGQNNDFVEIRVSDTGIGIAEKDYQIIFEEFRQASEGYSRNFEGTGLGLSITKKLVKKCGGKITVESEIGKGTTFTVIIPIKNDDAKKNELSTKEIKIIPKINKQKSVKPTALLVDDDPLVFTLLKIYADEYIELDTTVDAEFAIKKLKKKQYDLIFMDINLRRGMDGKEATKKIRTMTGYESIPIIATTAYAMPGDKEEFLAAGCSHYLSKPFVKSDIAELLGKVLKL